MVKDIKENNTQNFIKIINLFDFLGCINSLKFLRGFLLPTGKKKKKTGLMGPITGTGLQESLCYDLYICKLHNITNPKSDKN